MLFTTKPKGTGEVIFIPLPICSKSRKLYVGRFRDMK
jgi:hypothetical protein